MYSLRSYANMIADRGRMDAYTGALRRRVTPGSVVLDLGAGPGAFSLLACRYGARKVYAVEYDDVIQVGRECAAAAGLADRIEFIQRDSMRVSLPEKVDGIIADLCGALPFYEKSLAVMIDARERFLRPGGWMIAMRNTLYVAVASCPAVYNDGVTPWGENPYGLDMKPGRERVVNTWSGIKEKDVELVTEPRTWGVLDYKTLKSPNAEGKAEMEARRPSEAHGLSVWFDCETAEGLGFSNNPAAREGHVYQHGFFHWPEPVAMIAGDVVSVFLKATLVGSSHVWQWHSRIQSAGGHTKAEFRQNSLAGSTISPERLRRRANGHVPALGEEGKITLEILQHMQAGARLEEIAREIHQRFPARYGCWQDALTEVGELSVKYSV